MAADKRNEDEKLTLYSFDLHRNEAKLKETGAKTEKNRYFFNRKFRSSSSFPAARRRPRPGRWPSAASACMPELLGEKKLKLQPGFVIEEGIFKGLAK